MIEAVEALKNSGRVIVDEDHDWGYQLRFVNEPEYCGKLMVLTNSKKGSFHFHHKKKETFIILFGVVTICNENYGSMTFTPGDLYTFDPNVAHLMWATEYPAVILEVSTHDDDSDTYRIKEGDKE